MTLEEQMHQEDIGVVADAIRWCESQGDEKHALIGAYLRCYKHILANSPAGLPKNMDALRTYIHRSIENCNDLLANIEDVLIRTCIAFTKQYFIDTAKQLDVDVSMYEEAASSETN